MREWAFQQISPNGPTFWTRMTPDEAMECQRLASGRRVLEVGTGYGYSTANMVLAGARHVVSVDPHKPSPDNDGQRYGDTAHGSVENMKFYGIGNVQATLEQDTFEGLLPKLAAAGDRFGLILVDGSSEARHVSADVQGALGLLDDGGNLAVMNYGDPDYGTTAGVQHALPVLEDAAGVRQVGSLLIIPAPVIAVTARPDQSWEQL